MSNDFNLSNESTPSNPLYLSSNSTQAANKTEKKDKKELSASTPLLDEEEKIREIERKSIEKPLVNKVVPTLKKKVNTSLDLMEKVEKKIDRFAKAFNLEIFNLKSKFFDESYSPLKDEKVDDDKWIVQVWDDGKGHVAEEKAERINTVFEIKEAALAEKKVLNKSLITEKSATQKKEIQKRIDQLDKTLKKCEKSPVTWANSDFFRDLLREKSSAGKIGESLKEKIERYESIIREDYVTFSLPVNMRYHTCEVQENASGEITGKGWLRLGIITDLSNGYVNLESLNELKSKLVEGDLKSAMTLRNEMVKDILLVLKNNHKKEAAFVSAGYALQELGFNQTEIEALFEVLNTKSALIEIGEISLQAKEKILETVQKREKILEAQFLQLVMENLKKATKEQFEGGVMKMLHVSLLNPQSKSVDATGWNHDEKNEMYDMAAIFEKFDNAKLICDGKGPFVDEEGNIHLPKGLENVKYGKAEVLTLRSLFVNQCVQGSFSFKDLKESPVLNQGDQRVLNDRAEKKLREMETDHLKIKKILQAKKTGFKSAADLIGLADDAGFQVSTGCLSAKDRTGFVSALISDGVMKGFPKKSRVKFMREQLKKTSVAVRIVQDNTGVQFMKLTDFKLEGISKNLFNIKSIAVRITVYAEQMFGLM